MRQSELRAPVLAAVSAAIAGLPEEAVDEEQKSICGALKDGVASKVLVQLAHHREGQQRAPHRASRASSSRAVPRGNLHSVHRTAVCVAADAAMMQVVATVKSDLQSKSPSLITHP